MRVENTEWTDEDELNSQEYNESKVVNLSTRESQLSRIQRERQNDNMVIGGADDDNLLQDQDEFTQVQDGFEEENETQLQQFLIFQFGGAKY